MNSTRSLIVTAFIAIASLLGGCTSPALTSAMVPTSLGAVTKHIESLSINVTGGAEAMAQISNADFSAALGQAIQQSGLFAQIKPMGSTGAYHLEVSIVRLQQPMMGFSMTATLETNWTLSRVSDHNVIWQKAITTSHTAKTSEAFVGATRVRLATEGAARDNIQDALGQLSAVALP